MPSLSSPRSHLNVSRGTGAVTAKAAACALRQVRHEHSPMRRPDAGGSAS
jgi:hypothetical protein